jgi:hypothetical protein
MQQALNSQVLRKAKVEKSASDSSPDSPYSSSEEYVLKKVKVNAREVAPQQQLQKINTAKSSASKKSKSSKSSSEKRPFMVVDGEQLVSKQNVYDTFGGLLLENFNLKAIPTFGLSKFTSCG